MWLVIRHNQLGETSLSMGNYSDPTMQDRLNRASEAKAATLAKFKRAMDPSNPKAMETRRAREAIAAARPERELARQAALAAEAAAKAERAAAEQAAREAAVQVERAAALKAEQKAERDA